MARRLEHRDITTYHTAYVRFDPEGAVNCGFGFRMGLHRRNLFSRQLSRPAVSQQNAERVSKAIVRQSLRFPGRGGKGA